MKYIQVVKGFSQVHAYKISIPQIGNHQAHPVIHTIGLINQEVSCKHA